MAASCRSAPIRLPQFFENPRKELPFSGVFSWKDGRLRLLTHELHNFAWGGKDGRTLYLCARSAHYRIELLQPGIRP